MQKPISVKYDTFLDAVLEKLLYHKISRLIVQDKGKTVGIISEKDIGMFLFKDKTNRSLEQIPIKEMSKKVVFADESLPVDECAQIMISKNIGSLVIGNENITKGIVTKTDLVRYFAENYVGKNQVADLKNLGYVSVPSDASLSDVVKTMIEKNIARIIITDQKKTPVGIITFRDFFRITLQLCTESDVTEPSALSGHLHTGFLWDGGFGGISLAKDIMTQKIISVRPDDDLAQACSAMLRHQISGLAIVDNRRVGVFSKTDIVQILTWL